MRQFFSWRIWAACAALVVIVVLLRVVLPAGAAREPAPQGPAARTIDFVSFIYQVQPSGGFGVSDGVVRGSADLVIDGKRTMHIVAGTPGSMDCPEYLAIGRCVVVADLLGEAVVWFDLVPVQPGYKVDAPPVAEILDGGVVRLTNGWLIRTADTVDRRCDTETGSLAEFLRVEGPASTTIIDVATQRVTAVLCAGARQPTTTSSPPPSSVEPGAVTSTAVTNPSDPVPEG